MEKQKLEISTDSVLIEQYRNGSKSALDCLVRRYYSSVFTYVLRMCGNRETSVDITQDVFVRVINDLANYRDRGSFQAWLFRIARNAMIDSVRKKKTRFKYMDGDSDGYVDFENCSAISDDTPLQELEKQEQKEWIEKAVLALPAKLREVYLMREHGGLSFKEIAAIHHCSVNTVLGRMRYAMQHLREHLQQNLGVEVKDVL